MYLIKDVLKSHTHTHTQLMVEGKPGSLYLSFSDGCPHALLREHFENFLNSSRSLPLLLQGLCATEKTMAILSDFITSLPKKDTVGLSSVSPPQVQLKYNNLYPELCVCVCVCVCVGIWIG